MIKLLVALLVIAGFSVGQYMLWCEVLEGLVENPQTASVVAYNIAIVFGFVILVWTMSWLVFDDEDERRHGGGGP